MSAQKMLEQLLKSGVSMLDDGKGRAGKGGFSAGRSGSSLGGMLGAGGASAGLMGMLLGGKRKRGMGSTALKVGTVAALGAVAYKAYNHWQSQQAQPPQAAPQGEHLQPADTASPATHAAPAAASAVPTVSEAHSRALLKAMIAAAKSDGHLDERELGLIHDELEKLGAEPELQRWMEDELRKPLDPADVARAATTPELASEMYFTSLLVVDGTAFMERAYLDELARQLKIEPGLKAELEKQARPY